MPRPRSTRTIRVHDGQRIRLKMLTETNSRGTRQRAAEDVIECCDCGLRHRFVFTVLGDVLTWRAYRI